MTPTQRVRIWNSKIASRIDSQLPTRWDRRLFRKLISQNELDESQLRCLFKRWRMFGKRQSFCEYLADSGIISIDTQKSVSWEATISEPGQDGLYVTLNQHVAMELVKTNPARAALIQFVHRVLSWVLPGERRSQAVSA